MILLGSLWIYSVVYLMMLFTWLFCKIVSDCNRKFRKILKLKRRLNRVLFFKSLIGLGIEGYFEFAIVFTLNLLYGNGGQAFNGEIIGYISAWIFGVLVLIASPALVIWTGCQSSERLMSEKFEKRISILVEDIELRNRLNYWYWLLFILRRLSFVIMSFSG